MSENYELLPFTEDLTSAVKAFNQRLQAGGLDKVLLYPEHHIPRFPRRDGSRVYQEQFLLCDAERNVRGGFILTQEQWSFHGVTAWVAHLRLPISEGAVNKRFKAVGPRIFEAALSQQPNLYTLGMGGFETAVSRRIKSLGWSMAATPFYFKVFRAAPLLRTSPYLRKRPWARMAVNLAAITGAGALGIRTLQFSRTRRSGAGEKEIAVEEVPCFGEWADAVWEQTREAYGLIAPRDGRTLNERYPSQDRRFLKLKFSRGSRAFGWVVLLDTAMRGNKYFGDARVGSVVDYLAAPVDADGVIRGATEFLRARGVDLAVSNQMHAAWGRALRGCGYLDGPSNYVFALSQKAAEIVKPFERNLGEFLVSRGDGAGPERLME